MTDVEIKKYLDNHCWSVNAQDAFMDIFNTSPQITDNMYDFKNHTMAITTPENIFVFKWVLGDPIERK